MVKYFVKRLKVHIHPVSARKQDCGTRRVDEPLLDSPPEGVEKCDLCFGLVR